MRVSAQCSKHADRLLNITIIDCCTKDNIIGSCGIRTQITATTGQLFQTFLQLLHYVAAADILIVDCILLLLASLLLLLSLTSLLSLCQLPL
jgi:hypothetical protein